MRCGWSLHSLAVSKAILSKSAPMIRANARKRGCWSNPDGLVS